MTNNADSTLRKKKTRVNRGQLCSQGLSTLKNLFLCSQGLCMQSASSQASYPKIGIIKMTDK
jgi:hypothetical protein